MAGFFSMGEALIDFIPIDVDTDLKNVSGFIKKPGGAPANVAAAVARLGNSASFIGKLGEDAFGDYLVETMSGVGINTDSVITSYSIHYTKLYEFTVSVAFERDKRKTGIGLGRPQDPVGIDADARHCFYQVVTESILA